MNPRAVFRPQSGLRCVLASASPRRRDLLRQIGPGSRPDRQPRCRRNPLQGRGCPGPTPHAWRIAKGRRRGAPAPGRLRARGRYRRRLRAPDPCPRRSSRTRHGCALACCPGAVTGFWAAVTLVRPGRPQAPGASLRPTCGSNACPQTNSTSISPPENGAARPAATRSRAWRPPGSPRSTGPTATWSACRSPRVHALLAG